MSELASLRVEQAGPLALLQDAGRFGVRRLGPTQETGWAAISVRGEEPR